MTGINRSIVVNGRFLAKPVGGVARVGRELLRALGVALEARGLGPLRVAAPPAWRPSSPALIAAAGPASLLGEQVLPLRYPGATFLSFCNTTPVLLARSVLWLHDAHTFDAPETYSPAYRAWTRFMFAAAKLRGFRIVTVSNFSRGRLIAHGLSAARIEVIHNGGDHLLAAPPDPNALKTYALAPRGFVLVMGSPAKLKNMPFAIEALAEALDPSLKIAVVGMSQAGPYAGGGARGADPRVLILPMLSDPTLRALYAQARLVIVPSLLEGFGLFAAEALFEGAPLMLSDRGAHPEVGGRAALYFDPTSKDSFKETLEKAMAPSAEAAMREASLRQSQIFTWRRAADAVIDKILIAH